jgi:sucrose phosphorylase
MCLQGIPAFYIHSFTATPNDLEGLERTGRYRSINRKRWDAEELAAKLADPGDTAAVAMKVLTKRLRLRASVPEFHPEVPQEVVKMDPRCLVVRRKGLTAAHNFSDEAVELPGVSGEEVLMKDEGVEVTDSGLRLPPRSVCWMRHG